MLLRKRWQGCTAFTKRNATQAIPVEVLVEVGVTLRLSDSVAVGDTVIATVLVAVPGAQGARLEFLRPAIPCFPKELYIQLKRHPQFKAGMEA